MPQRTFKLNTSVTAIILFGEQSTEPGYGAGDSHGWRHRRKRICQSSLTA